MGNSCSTPRYCVSCTKYLIFVHDTISTISMACFLYQVNIMCIIVRYILHRSKPQFEVSSAWVQLKLLFQKLKDLHVSSKRAKLKKALWLVSIGRNALVVLSTSTLAFILHDPTRPPLFKLSGTRNNIN